MGFFNFRRKTEFVMKYTEISSKITRWGWETIPGGGSPAAVGAHILVEDALLVSTLVLLDQGLPYTAYRKYDYRRKHNRTNRKIRAGVNSNQYTRTSGSGSSLHNMIYGTKHDF
jgi:hypothetical protein